MSTLFELTVPGYIRGLEQLSHCLARAEKWANEQNVAHEALLGASLHSDMRPLPFQIWKACSVAKMVSDHVAEIPSPSAEDNQKNFSDLQARIRTTVDFLQTMKPQDFENKGGREIVMRAARTFTFPTGIAYLQTMGIPNFWFHVTTAYCILRSQGVPLGKMDFLGPLQIG